LSQTDAVKSLFFWKSPHPLSIVRVNYLAGRAGDAANAVLAAVGYNFRLLLVWLAGLWQLLPTLVRSAGTAAPHARYAT
jgi:hypothetical protein